MVVTEFLRLARIRLFDPAPGAGWTDDELVDYLNYAQRRLCFLKPDAYVRQAVIVLVRGATQAIPDDGIALLDVVGNGPGGLTVTQVNEELLKAANRAFRTDDPSLVIENYATDSRNPTRFLVTPPAVAGATLEIVYGAVPPDLDANRPAGETALPTSYEATLFDGVFAQAFAKVGKRHNPVQAANYLAAFNMALGVKDKQQQIIAPKPGE